MCTACGTLIEINSPALTTRIAKTVRRDCRVSADDDDDHLHQHAAVLPLSGFTISIDGGVGGCNDYDDDDDDNEFDGDDDDDNEFDGDDDAVQVCRCCQFFRLVG